MAGPVLDLFRRQLEHIDAEKERPEIEMQLKR
ncbi:hypothetical protein ACJX0J_042167 [Zea mays]